MVLLFSRDSTIAALERGDRCPCWFGHPGFHPGRGAEVFSHGPDCCRTKEFPQFMVTVDDVPVVLSYRFSRVGVEETFVLPQLQGFAGISHFARCVPCCRSHALMPCIMAGMDQRYLDMVVRTPVVCNDICLWFRLHKTVESPQLQFFCSSSSLSWRRCRFSWSFTTEFPQLQYTKADVPVEQVMQVHFLVVAQRPFLMVRLVWQTIEISQLQYALGGQCSCYAGRASLVKLAQDMLVGPCTLVHGQG